MWVSCLIENVKTNQWLNMPLEVSSSMLVLDPVSDFSDLQIKMSQVVVTDDHMKTSVIFAVGDVHSKDLHKLQQQLEMVLLQVKRPILYYWTQLKSFQSFDWKLFYNRPDFVHKNSSNACIGSCPFIGIVIISSTCFWCYLRYLSFISDNGATFPLVFHLWQGVPFISVPKVQKPSSLTCPRFGWDW